MRIIRGTILLLNVFAILLLIMAYASYHVKPDTIPYMGIAGLAYPYILFINMLFFIFWLTTRWKYAIISLLFILAGWNHIGRLVQFNSQKTDNQEIGGIKILSYNMQNFLKLNASNTKYVSNFENQERIINFLKEEKADILCLQEMLNDRIENKSFTDNLADMFNSPYYYHKNYFSTIHDKLDAIVIFTRFPFIDKGHLVYQKKTIGIFVDIVVEKDTMRVYNLHLASIHFRAEDYQFWSDITNQQEQEKLRSGTLKIFGKIQTAFLKRAHQVDIISKHLSESPYPTIICGDFNDTPSSYAYNKLAGDKKDCFVESGSGFGSTYAGEFFPSFRIDFILFDGPFHSKGFLRHKIPFSDHYPITTYLYTN